jgi:tetratricopeptide (TPR) repeat protein
MGNRPGIDNRPGVGDRPGIGNRPGIGDRPGIDNRPGIGNRPGIDNRPGIADRPGSAIGSNLPSNINVNRPGGAVDPGYGVRPPAYNNWRGAYWGYHQGWANGYWHGYHDNNYWGWGGLAAGTAVGVTAWALGSAFYNWGYASYANPYYAAAPVAEPIVIEQTVAGGEPQTVSVPALPYDYSQPIDTQATPPPSEVADPAVAKFDAGRQAFGSGDYAGALQLTDEALKVLPNDATLHEFRALVLFAVGKYDLAAGPLYAVLSVGPGWDWPTMAGLYPSIDVYTAQLRKLEAFVTANPNSTSGRFVLAYHYMTQGHIDAAVDQFKGVVALAPQDTLSAQLVRQFSKPGTAPETQPASPAPTATAAPVKQSSPLGNWTAHPNNDSTIRLNLADDGTFTWTVDAKGKTQRLAGKWSLADDMLTLAESGQAGALVGRVTWQADDRWNFRLLGGGAEDPGLAFTR